MHSCVLKRFSIIVFVLSIVACDDGASRVTQSTDDEPPTLEISFPNSPTNFDNNQDGFVDISVAWSDSGEGVDLGSVTIRSAKGVNGEVSARANLLNAWNVERID